MELKQVIAMRRDLKLSKGKLAAQVSHASLGAYKLTAKKYPEKAKEWDEKGGKKIIVWVADLKELYELKESIPGEVPTYIVINAGLTEVKPGTVTCIGIGPWEANELDRYTKHLKLVG